MFLAAYCVLCGAAYFQEGAAPAQDVDALIAALDGAIEASRHDLEFACTYVLRSGFVVSEQDALAGRCAFEVVRGRGFLAKKGPVMRNSYRYDSGREEERVHEECVATPTVTLEGRSYGKPLTVEIGPRDQATAQLLTPCRSGALPPVYPLEFAGAGDGEPLRSILMRPSSDKAWRLLKKDVQQLEDGRIVVTFVLDARNGAAEYTERITFGLKEGVPIIEKRERHCRGECTRRPGDLWSTIIALRFAKVKGGWLASHIRRVLGPVVEGDVMGNGSQRIGFKVEEWESEDLGQRLPTRHDFVVTLPPGSHVVGARLDNPGQIDLLAMEQRDLWDEDDHSTQPAAIVTGTVEPSSRWFYVCLAAGTLALAAAYLVVSHIWRGRGKHA